MHSYSQFLTRVRVHGPNRVINFTRARPSTIWPTRSLLSLQHLTLATMSYLPPSVTESIYIAIVERRPDPAHAHLSAPSSSSEILGVFRTADEAKQRVRAEVGDDCAKLTEWVHGERGLNTWVEKPQGCLRIFDVV